MLPELHVFSTVTSYSAVGEAAKVAGNTEVLCPESAETQRNDYSLLVIGYLSFSLDQDEGDTV